MEIHDIKQVITTNKDFVSQVWQVKEGSSILLSNENQAIGWNMILVFINISKNNSKRKVNF